VAPGYSPAIVAEGRRVVFVSGQGPRDLKAAMETQIRQTSDRIGLVLKAGGASFADVVTLRA
jgi:enamine deaminase RidA (YjgF/YER057c/UK114 family)